MASLKLSRFVEEVVNDFLDQVAQRYHIPKTELLELWECDRAPVGVSNYCNHQFTKGQRVGMMCQQKIADHETKCGKHRSKKRAPIVKEEEEEKIASVDLLSRFDKLTFSAEHSDSE